MKVPGAAGYEDIAAGFIERTDRMTFEIACRHILHLVPSAPSRVLDIGAAQGRDASALLAHGHRVTAVEPTDVLRNTGRSRHPGIEWLDDALPDLGSLKGREGGFDLVLAIAMWMHLDPLERSRSMVRIAELMADDATFALCLRHGPFPDNRRRFDLSAEETVSHAAAQGLDCVLNLVAPAVQETNRKLGVVWTWLAFRRQ